MYCLASILFDNFILIVHLFKAFVYIIFLKPTYLYIAMYYVCHNYSLITNYTKTYFNLLAQLITLYTFISSKLFHFTFSSIDCIYYLYIVYLITLLYLLCLLILHFNIIYIFKYILLFYSCFITLYTITSIILFRFVIYQLS